MDLYLKMENPNGRKIKLMDVTNPLRPVRRNGKVVEYMFHNDRPTVISENDGKAFIEQDPHLLSTEKPDFSKPFPTTVDEWKAKNQDLEGDLKEAVKDQDRLEKQVESQEREIERHANDNTKFNELVKNLKQENESIKQTIDSLKKQLEMKDKALAAASSGAKKVK